MDCGNTVVVALVVVVVCIDVVDEVLEVGYSHETGTNGCCSCINC